MLLVLRWQAGTRWLLQEKHRWCRAWFSSISCELFESMKNLLWSCLSRFKFSLALDRSLIIHARTAQTLSGPSGFPCLPAASYSFPCLRTVAELPTSLDGHEINSRTGIAASCICMRQQCLLAGFDKVVGASAAFIGDMGGFGGVAMLLSQGTWCFRASRMDIKGRDRCPGPYLWRRNTRSKWAGHCSPSGNSTWPKSSRHQWACRDSDPRKYDLWRKRTMYWTTECLPVLPSYLLILRACVSSFHIEYDLNSVVIISWFVSVLQPDIFYKSHGKRDDLMYFQLSLYSEDCKLVSAWFFPRNVSTIFTLFANKWHQS